MTLSTSALAILPIANEHWLCRTRGAHVEPLAKAPGQADACFVFAPDGATFAVLDSASKRAGLFRVLAEEPWFERVLGFSTLPKRCVGHAVAVVGGSLLVGGESPTGEALWTRHAADGSTWRVVPLPAELCFPGKAIDGLLLEGRRLIAVDDIALPKWVLEYAVEEDDELRCIDARELPIDTTYERIVASAWGAPGAALLSGGVNHGSVGAFVSLLDGRTLREVACWSAHSDPVEREATRPEGPALLEARDVAFVGRTLLVACGSRGLLRLDLRSLGASRAAPPAPVHVATPGLAGVARIVAPTPPDDSGAFLVGADEAGVVTHAWLDLSSVEAAT